MLASEPAKFGREVYRNLFQPGQDRSSDRRNRCQQQYVAKKAGRVRFDLSNERAFIDGLLATEEARFRWNVGIIYEQNYRNIGLW